MNYRSREGIGRVNPLPARKRAITGIGKLANRRVDRAPGFGVTIRNPSGIPTRRGPRLIGPASGVHVVIDLDRTRITDFVPTVGWSLKTNSGAIEGTNPDHAMSVVARLGRLVSRLVVATFVVN